MCILDERKNLTGSLAISRWADNQVGIGAYIIPAATGKGKRKKCGYKSQLPRYGGKSTDNHNVIVLLLLMWLYTTPQSYDFFLKLPRISGVFFYHYSP